MLRQPADARSPARVLVVDDEEAVRTFVARALAQAGYDVATAPGGTEALKLVDGAGRFDVYVLDVIMPGMTGDEVGYELRKRDPDAKILYFTGYADHLFKDRPMLAAYEAFLDKPVTLAGLQQAVSLLLFGRTHG